MATTLDTFQGRASVSPSSSGRGSPVPAKWSQFRNETPTNKDKSFRRYAAGVDRSLSLFDTALQEWADYISFLGRLLKSLQARSETIHTIPSKTIIAKRLAQCLNPSLPSGVHQKAIEVYAYIFATIGSQKLSRDLPLYLPGLASTLSFASLSVRTPFLDLLEQYFLQLDASSLRPALKTFILALLPGLEEENSEEFERVLRLLDAFKTSLRPINSEPLSEAHWTGDEYFWQCFFLAVITSNARRLGALAYLVRNLPKLSQSHSGETLMGKDFKEFSTPYSASLAKIVISPEPGLLVRCFAAGLGDDNVLIQRGFQDLLLSHLPLHADVLQKNVTADDLELLVMAAASVVNRREMSLNRRLWSWLLGPERPINENDNGTASPTTLNATSSNPQFSIGSGYFEAFGMAPLTNGLLKILNRDTLHPMDRVRPYRICLSLMDRWEIGGTVVPMIFLPIIKNVQRYRDLSATKADFSEVLKSASVFFDGVESGLIWGEIARLFCETTKSISTLEKVELLSVVHFIITYFNVREEEMLLIHAPLAALLLVTLLEDSDSLATDFAKIALQIAIDLVELIPTKAFVTLAPKKESNKGLDSTEDVFRISGATIIANINKFYAHDQGSIDSGTPPFATPQIGDFLLEQAGRLVSLAFADESLSLEVDLRSKLLMAILVKVPRRGVLDTGKIISTLKSSITRQGQQNFQVFASAVSLVTALVAEGRLTLSDLSSLVDPLVRRAWSFLEPKSPKYHVETARCLWHLQMALSLSNREIEASICSIMRYNDSRNHCDYNSNPTHNFVVLWTHIPYDNASYERRASRSSISGGDQPHNLMNVEPHEIILGRPLFLLLDALRDERTEHFVTTRTWLQGVTNIDKILRIFMSRVPTSPVLHNKYIKNSLPRDRDTCQYDDENDLEQLIYYISTICNVLKYSLDTFGDAIGTVDFSSSKISISVVGSADRVTKESFSKFFSQVCLHAVCSTSPQERATVSDNMGQLHQAALLALQQILASPYALSMAGTQVENILIERLHHSLSESDPVVQALLLDVVQNTLKLNNNPRHESQLRSISPIGDKHHSTLDATIIPPEPGVSAQQGGRLSVPSSLIECLRAGLTAEESRPVLDNWVNFLVECIPLYGDMIFQVLVPLVETFCAQIQKTFESLKGSFELPSKSSSGEAFETTLITLLHGLEHVLAQSHDQLVQDEAKLPLSKVTEQQTGFFGNMVSGVFSSEMPPARSGIANNRLTILLSFRDAVRISFEIWSWGNGATVNLDPMSIASFNYVSLRMRNRARRLLEHVFTAETLECIESIIEIRQNLASDNLDSTQTINILHVLDSSRPKYAVSAIFNAIYSRTNPSALDPSRKSSLTSSLSDVDLANFLVVYAKSLDDDAMDEIWNDCMLFLRDLLANPFPHRQTLPSLLEFSAILGEKVDNTNFGEQRRMRRELGDLFLRLLTAICTTRPLGLADSTTEEGSVKSSTKHGDVIKILSSVTSALPKILVEQDRVTLAANTMLSGIISPAFKSKSFPEIVTRGTLDLLRQLSQVSNSQKALKRDISDAFNDPRFFSSPPSLVNSDWLPLLRIWCVGDKERFPELLSRLQPPTTAGIVFGVGATSARLEADRRTQLNLRRISTLILCAIDDNFVGDIPALLDKIIELLAATTTSSPSSSTRADVFLLIRSVILKTSPLHLTTFWPILIPELQAAISSVVAPDHSVLADTYNNGSVLQACKLLDCLICLAPDDFQVHRWLFVTDTIDAVYRPSDTQPQSLTDEISEELGSVSNLAGGHVESSLTEKQLDKSRHTLIGPGGIDDRGIWDRRDELVGRVLRPFFGQLSIFAFESTYSMGLPDVEACRFDLLRDLFDDKAIARST